MEQAHSFNDGNCEKNSKSFCIGIYPKICCARFYFKQKQFQTAITLVKKSLQIYPSNHRLRKSTVFDLYRYQMVDAHKKGNEILAEELKKKLKELESELRDRGFYIV